MRSALVLIFVMACGSKGDSAADVDLDGSGQRDTSAPDSGGDEPVPECMPARLELSGLWQSSDFERDTTSPLPPILGSCGWGLAAVDLNEDEWVDLLVVGVSASTQALVNTGGTLEPSGDISFDGGLLPPGNGIAVGDINQDGRPDLVLTRTKGSRDLVYINQGGGNFSSTMLTNSHDESQQATLFDADGDGDLDLFISRHLDAEETGIGEMDEQTVRADHNGFYLNDGGFFTLASSIGVSDAASFQSLPIDVDDDGDLDLYLVNDFGMFIAPNELLLNDGSGGFSVAEDCGCDLAIFGMGASASDFNNDGMVDLHVTNFGSPRLLQSIAPIEFVDTTLASGAFVEPSGDRVTSWGTVFVDLDQNGWDDMATAYGPVLVGVPGDWTDFIDDPSVAGLDDSPSQLLSLMYNTEGQFEERGAELGFDYRGVTRAVVKADFNADGMPDLAIAGVNEDRTQFVRIFESRDGCGGGITVGFPEVGARDIGSVVEWSVGGRDYRRWYQPSAAFSSSGPTMHLGLAGHERADWVRVTRLGGEVAEYVDVAAGSRLDQRSYQ